MNLLIITSVLIFAAVATAVYAISARMATEKSPVAIRLRQLRSMHAGEAHVSYGQRPPALLKLIAQVGGFMPANEGGDALRTGLIRAGYRRQDAVLVFLGSKILLAVGLPLIVSSIGYLAARPMGNVVMMTMISVGVGFYLPTMFIWLKQRQRHDDILCSLPDALDLMVVCVEAGLGMAAALQRVGIEMQLPSPE
ncbi:MAG: hypothetical protein ACRDF6_12765, partial [bacterium]